MDKELKKLKKENTEIRRNINLIIKGNKDLWNLINKLIENELNIEDLCNF